MEEKRCKGTKKCVISEGLTFDDYKTCLFAGETIYGEQMLFENKKHEVYTVNKHKIAFNRDDDKRLVQADEKNFFFSFHLFYSHKKTLQGLQALQPNNNTKLIIKRNNS